MIFDVAVLGAGVVGSLVARELSKHTPHVCLIDRYPEPGCGTSKANSAIVHAGYDAKVGTQKATFNVRGCAMMEALCRELQVPYKNTGSLVLSFEESDDGKLVQLLEQGQQNGVTGLEIWTREQLMEREPHLSPAVRGALYAKTAGIVSPYALACAAAENAADNGVVLFFDTEIIEISKIGEFFTLHADSDDIQARFVVNCAGVYADHFAAEPDFHIQPRKGEYLLLDRKLDGLIHHVLFQTPTKAGKGILAAPTVHGNVLLGPTSVEVDHPEDTETTASGREQIAAAARRMLPEIDLSTVITSFAGVRAKSNTGDFLVQASASMPGLINAAGIESPGLTAAPAIAEHVADLLRQQGLTMTLKPSYLPIRPVPVLLEMTMEQRNALIHENPAYGRIVCRCETISEGEIVDAIRRSAGARTVDGVKRRVRAGMGRCQGGFCLPRVLEILAREMGTSPIMLTKKGGKSILLAQDMKGMSYDD